MRYVATNRKSLDSDDAASVVTFFANGSGAAVSNPSAWSEWDEKDWLALIGFTRPVLAFVHGFNNGFAKALVTAEKIQVAVPSHQVVMIDWANKSDIFDYAHDEIMCRQGAPLFTDVFKMFGPQVSVVAHSMGNRLFRWAMAETKTPVIARFASVEADDGRDAPTLIPAVTAGGIWVGRKDGALMASEVEHAAERLGLRGARLPVPPNWKQYDFTPFMSSDPLKLIENHSLLFDLPEFYQDLNKFLS